MQHLEDRVADDEVVLAGRARPWQPLGQRRHDLPQQFVQRLGIGMVVPGAVVFAMVIGGVLQWLWERSNPRAAQQYSAPLASGLIAGEAIVAIVIPLLVAVGVLGIPR